MCEDIGLTEEDFKDENITVTLEVDLATIKKLGGKKKAVELLRKVANSE